MEPIADKKIHVALYARQAHEVERLLRQGRIRSTSELVRAAIDHYPDHLDRPTLAQQAAQMAEDFARNEGLMHDEPSTLQEPSMMSEETW